MSSMNLYSASSGGFTKEAGIVSIDEKVVESVLQNTLLISFTNQNLLITSIEKLSQYPYLF